VDLLGITHLMGYLEPMVVVHRALGFRFVIYTLDHGPAHVHITGAGQAKIDLSGRSGEPEIVYSIESSDPTCAGSWPRSSNTVTRF